MVILDYTSLECRWPRLARQLGSLCFAFGFVWLGSAPYCFNITSAAGTLSFWIAACGCRIVALTHDWHLDVYDLVSSTVGVIFFVFLKITERYAAEAGMVWGMIQIVILSLYIGNINMDASSAPWDTVQGGIMWVSSSTCCLLFLTLVVSLERISRTEKQNVRTDAAEIQARWRLMQQETESFSAIRGIELCAEAINVSMSHTGVSHAHTHTHTNTHTHTQYHSHTHTRRTPFAHATHDGFRINVSMSRINVSMSHITEAFQNTIVIRAATYKHATHPCVPLEYTYKQI